MGSVRVALDIEMKSFHPHDLSAGAARRFANEITPGLLKFTDDYVLSGVLAESFRMEGEQANLTIAPGRELHNGRPIDAELVAANIRRLSSPATGGYQSREFDVVRDVRCSGKHGLRISLRRRQASFLHLLANHVGITDPLEMDNASLPIGAGPFAMVEWLPGRGMKLERVHSSAARVGQVDLLFQSDARQRTNWLLEGKCDAVWMPDLSRVEELESLGFNITVVPGQGPTHIAFNMRSALWSMRSVRSAVAHAIDRRELVDKLFGGYGRASWTPYASGNPWYVDLPEPKYDPDFARWLLRRDGIPTIKETLYVDGPSGARAASHLSDQLRGIGIELQPRPMPSTEWWPDFYMSGQWSIAIQSWFAMPDPDHLLGRRYHSAGVFNSGGFRSARIDSLLERGAQEGDFARRHGIYAQVQAAILEDLPSLYLYHSPMATASRAEVAGVVPTVQAELPLSRIHLAS